MLTLLRSKNISYSYLEPLGKPMDISEDQGPVVGSLASSASVLGGGADSEDDHITRGVASAARDTEPRQAT